MKGRCVAHLPLVLPDHPQVGAALFFVSEPRCANPSARAGKGNFEIVCIDFHGEHTVCLQYHGYDNTPSNN